VVASRVEALRGAISEVIASQHLPIPTELIMGLVDLESGGDPTQINPNSGAMGLTQLMPIAIKDYNQRHKTTHSAASVMASPKLQLEIGVDIYAQYLRKAWRLLAGKVPFNTRDIVSTALMCYVWGPGNVELFFKKIESPTWDFIQQNYHDSKAPKYARVVLSRAAELNPVWNDEALKSWLSATSPGGYTPTVPLISDSNRKGVVLALALFALGFWVINDNGKI